MSSPDDNSQRARYTSDWLASRKFPFAVVMGRLKSALGLKTDAALYQLLGMSSSTYANRKSGGSIPYEQVIALCVSRSVNINWLFTGEGPTLADGRTIVVPSAIQEELLGRVFLELFDAIARAPDGAEIVRSLKGGWTKYIALMGILAGGIHNAIVFEPDEKKQAQLRKEKLADAIETLRHIKLLEKIDASDKATPSST